MNDINTWSQGHFVDHPRYKDWAQEEKDRVEEQENIRVRPSLTGNAICMTATPDNAKWIASRLNLASDLEEMTYRFATGKSDGEEIKKYVLDKLKG